MINMGKAEEREFQIECMSALRLREAQRRDIMAFHVPNGGGAVSWQQGKDLKQQGVRAGAPDIVVFLAGARAVCFELKTPQGKFSPQQFEISTGLWGLGIPYFVVQEESPAAAAEKIMFIVDEILAGKVFVPETKNPLAMPDWLHPGCGEAGGDASCISNAQRPSGGL